MSIDKPTIICLTPIKNEAWILDRFLTCTSLWADQIILADQYSTDHSIEIASKYPKAKVIRNEVEEYNEVARQNLLLNEARKTPGKKLLITLDADEIFTANYMHSHEWKTMLEAEEGTMISFNWVNINPDFDTCIVDRSLPMYWGFMDDGSPHIGHKFHSQRIPFPEKAKVLHLKEIKVLHYAYVHPPRLKSKLNWYKCYEMAYLSGAKARFSVEKYNNANRSHLYKSEPLRKEWLKGYEDLNIDMSSVKSVIFYRHSIAIQAYYLSEFFWWDEEVLKMMEKFSAKHFAMLDIWDIDWPTLASYTGRTNLNTFKDPRSKVDKLWMKFYRRYYAMRNPYLRRLINLFLNIFGH